MVSGKTLTRRVKTTMKTCVFAIWTVCAIAVPAFSAELPRDVKYVAHQGEEALAPNHSVPAYKLAVEHKLDYMKLDVHETKDGVVVIQHDPTIKAMTGVDLAIKDTPYAELKKYVYRPRGGFTNETIVTLAEALAIAKALPGIWIDFKYFTPPFAEKVLKITAEAGISRDRIMVATFNQRALEYMRDHHPDIRRVGHISITHQPTKDAYTTSCAKGESFKTEEEVVKRILVYRDQMKLFGVNVPCRPTSRVKYSISKDAVRALKEAGLWVSIWFVNDAANGQYYREAGADAFVTANAWATVPGNTSGRPQ
jgi:glycerophosphoryl diester phosphodiesterase